MLRRTPYCTLYGHEGVSLNEIYEKFLDYEEMYKDKNEFWGTKADELVEKRDKVKAEAYAYFIKSENYLKEAEARTDISSVLKDIKKNRSLLKQLKDATKAGGF